MPLTPEERRELDAVKALATGLQRTVATLTTRLDALEKREVNLERLIAGVNQAGAMFAGLAQHQTTVKNPARPWEPV